MNFQTNDGLSQICELAMQHAKSRMNCLAHAARCNAQGDAVIGMYEAAGRWEREAQRYEENVLFAADVIERAAERDNASN